MAQQQEFPCFYLKSDHRTPDVVELWCVAFARGVVVTALLSVVTTGIVFQYVLSGEVLGMIDRRLIAIPIIFTLLLYLSWHLLDRYERRKIQQYREHLRTKACVKAALAEQNPEYTAAECERLANLLMHLDGGEQFQCIPASKGTEFIAPTVHQIVKEGGSWYVVRYLTERAGGGKYIVDAKTQLDLDSVEGQK